MSLKTSYPYIAKDPAVCGGKACIEATRIRVLDIACAAEQLALSPDEICDQYPELTLAQVHSAPARQMHGPWTLSSCELRALLLANR